MLEAIRAKFSKAKPRPAATAKEPVRPPPAGGYQEPFHAVVVGGGAAALEVALALRAHAGDLIDVQLVAEEPSFTSEAGAAESAAAEVPATRVTLVDFAAAIDAELTADRIVRIDAGERRIFTERRRLVDYDALVLCLGAAPQLRDGHAIDGLPKGAADGRIFSADGPRAEGVARDVARLAGVTIPADRSAPAPAGAPTPRLDGFLRSAVVPVELHVGLGARDE